ncbi:phosphoribosylamine--glycine ligase [archaeon]|jgi:phosphoribosylamine---glycine ligase|nr:phosphoribosylamine--glycine ligase [archaeon]MBT7392403.1 phosphoribosylamine--glycine ligase [archaeon]
MKVLILGSGGREHALAWKISKETNIEKIYCAPGNAGTYNVAENVNLDIMDNDLLIDFVKENSIGLTIVGPEAPLVNGIIDEFEKNNLKIFGPKKYAAMLEGSKVFSKKIMQKYGIPTSRGEVFSDIELAIEFVKSNPWARVVKADGLAAGKGVYVCDDENEVINAITEIMQNKKFGDAGNKILLEEKLVGEEASFLVFSDGKIVKPMVSTQDHKAVYVGDKGPNTGGMGAYGPAPVITKELHNYAMEKIMLPTINAMASEGTPYVGILYGGLMITKDGPKVIEFNCRFGDPEAQPILTLLKSNLIDIIKSCIDGTLDMQDVVFDEGAACCVVLASGGYPGAYEKGKKISGIALADEVDRVKVFHGGTKISEGDVLTNGGRVLGVTGIGNSIKESIDNAYLGVSKIDFENNYFRKDIGQKALGR